MDYTLVGFIITTVLLWFGGGWVISSAYVADVDGDGWDFTLTMFFWPILLIWVAAEELWAAVKTKIKGFRK